MFPTEKKKKKKWETWFKISWKTPQKKKKNLIINLHNFNMMSYSASLDILLGWWGKLNNKFKLIKNNKNFFLLL
jgi:hypothetical protein